MPTPATRALTKRPVVRQTTAWHVAMRQGKRAVLDETRNSGRLEEQLEKVDISIPAKVEHPLRVIKRQLGPVKVRYRGLAKNTVQLKTLFTLSNLWMVREKLRVLDGSVCPARPVAA
jgi:IS5 family transposase